MANNEVKKDKKPGFGSKIKAFFKSMKGEFRKIVWASHKSTLKNSLIVLVCAVVIAAVIGLLDWGLTSGFTFLGKVI